jgi:hypothetical protein
MLETLLIVRAMLSRSAARPHARYHDHSPQELEAFERRRREVDLSATAPVRKPDDVSASGLRAMRDH